MNFFRISIISVCLSGFGGCCQNHSSDNSQQRLSYRQLEPDSIKIVMKKVADWQLANPDSRPAQDWTHGALFAGLTAWAQMAESDKYYNALLDYGKKNQWKLYKRKYHADDHCVGQTYIDLYKKYKDPQMIEHVRRIFDSILDNPPKTDLKMGTKNCLNRWNWCDALFMAPAVWAKLARITGDDKYYEYMNNEWWATTDYLYDEHEHLFYRDSNFFKKREANNRKVFWSRGNGWVIAGLVRVLEELPENYPERPDYLKLYKEMAAKLIKIQPEHGLWHPSLLDPSSFNSKESSGTGFYTYALAWGINHGILDENTYLEPVVKAWKMSLIHNSEPTRPY